MGETNPETSRSSKTYMSYPNAPIGRRPYGQVVGDCVDILNIVHRMAVQGQAQYRRIGRPVSYGREFFKVFNYLFTGEEWIVDKVHGQLGEGVKKHRIQPAVDHAWAIGQAMYVAYLGDARDREQSWTADKAYRDRIAANLTVVVNLGWRDLV